MVDKKITELDADNAPTVDDLLVSVNDPAGTPTDKKVSIKDLFGLLYPVGSIYISTLATNPGTLLGVGTWAVFGAGKTLVSLDSGDTDFDAVQETGGSKTHWHWQTVGADSGGLYAEVAGAGSGQTRVIDINRLNTGGSSTTAPSREDGTYTASSLMPYITVYMWKRTA